MDSNMTLVSWNVEGLTEEKTETLKSLKHTQGWDIICMQEIWKRGSINEVDDQGFLIILSGQDATDVKNNRPRAGVGFMIAPWAVGSVLGFCPASPRAAALKIKIREARAG